MRHIAAPATGATLALLLALAATLLFSAQPAQARTALAELRVEGPAQTLDPGTWYVTGTERVKRGQGDECDPRSGSTRFAGPSALGILGSAADSNQNLDPVRARDTDFGPQVCQVGSLRSFGSFPGDSGGFLYWVDYVSGFSSADLAELRGGERVLWYYAEFGSAPVNDGLPLELKGVPARDGDGEFEVRVVAHDFDGTPRPADGATILGAESVTPLGDGRYGVAVAPGRTLLTAERGQDVRSNHVETCFKAKLDRCPKAHGRTIVGSDRGDELEGTRGDDVIRSGGGDDRIDLRKGGRDKVDCGAGDDVVVWERGDRDDRTAPSCERVVRR